MRLAAVLLATTLASLASNEFSGRRAPGFCLPDANFKRYDLQDYRGKWLLIEFMVTNCPHCKELSKALDQVKGKYGDRVAILSVVISPPDNRDTVAAYIKETGITTPVLFDQGQMAASYFNASPDRPTFHTPHLFVIDPKGTIVRDFGHSEENHELLEGPGLIRALAPLLAKAE